jgi:hypothetical protein
LEGALNNVTFIWLVVLTILKNDGVRQWVSDDIPYMENKFRKIRVPKHQPVIYGLWPCEGSFQDTVISG